MENIEKLLKQIFDNQNDMKNDISNMQNDISNIKTTQSSMQNDISNIKTTQSSMQNDISNIKNDICHINSKLDSVVDQTANLTEFRTEANKNFSDIKDTLKFLLHKEIETEKEIFKLKQVKENKIY